MIHYKPYSQYINSGVDWLGKVPSHWEIKKLKYVSSWKNSNVDKKSVEGQKLVKLCNYTDVYYSEYITDSKEFMKATAKKEDIRHFSLRTGDILITKDSESPDDIGIPAIVGKLSEEVLCGYHLTLIRSNLTTDSRFLFRSIQSRSSSAQFYMGSNGVTRYGLSKNAIGGLLLCIPPIHEQQRIASFLDRETTRIDELIEKKHRLIQLLQEKRLTIITQAVTKGLDNNVPMKDSGVMWLGEVPDHWEVSRAKYIFQIKKRIAGKLGFDVLSVTQKGLKVKDIETGEGQLSMDYSKYQLVEVGDFVMNHMDLLTGWVDRSQNEGVTSPDYRVFGLTGDSNCPDFYLRLCQIGYMEKIFFAYGQGVSHLGRWRLSAGNFKEFIFPVPPKSEQEAIARFISAQTSKMEKLIERTANSIILLKERRSALITAAVTGQIDIREEVA